MKKRHFAAAMLSMVLGAGFALPAHAAEDPWNFEKVFRMADMKKDGMITKEGFLKAMGMLYDSKMKEMKSDPKMVKGNAMTREGLRAVLNSVYHGA